jgi:hypothetical protein
MTILNRQQRNFFKMESRLAGPVLLLLPLMYCTCLAGQTPHLRIHIPGFTVQQDIWHGFVRAYQSSNGGMMGMFIPLLISIRAASSMQKISGVSFTMTRPFSRRLYFWANYAISTFQMVLAPIVGTVLVYLVMCAIFYPAHGWVGSLGVVHPPSATENPWHLDSYQTAVDFLATTSLPHLVLEQIVVGLFMVVALVGAALATGKMWAPFAVWVLMFYTKNHFFGFENDGLLHWFTPTHTALALLCALTVTLTAQQVFERRDL